MIAIGGDQKHLWAEAINTVCFIRTRFVARSCNSPHNLFEVIDRRKRDFTLLCNFGCNTFVCKPKENIKQKFEPWLERETLVGFCKGDLYRVLLSRSNKVIECKDSTSIESFEPTGEPAEECIAFDLDADINVILDDLTASHINAEAGTLTVDEPQEQGNINTEHLVDEETSTAEAGNN